MHFHNLLSHLTILLEIHQHQLTLENVPYQYVDLSPFHGRGLQLLRSWQWGGSRSSGAQPTESKAQSSHSLSELWTNTLTSVSSTENIMVPIAQVSMRLTCDKICKKLAQNLVHNKFSINASLHLCIFVQTNLIIALLINHTYRFS